MMRKTVLVSAVLAAAAGCAPFAFAQQDAPAPAPAWHGHRHAAMMGDHVYDKLNLTDAQRADIRQLTRQSIEQMKPQMQALHQKREAFEAALPGSAGYQAAANDLAQAEADAARARVLQRADLRARIYNVLTPAQRTQLANLRAQRMARVQQWKEFQQEHPLPSSSSSPSAQ